MVKSLKMKRRRCGPVSFNYRADWPSIKRCVAFPVLALFLFTSAHAGPSADDIPLYAVSLIGTPYRLGGISPETGLDCSGFVGHVFKQVAGVVLPRESLAISETAEPLTQAELLPGDLVFFNTLNRTFSHVGIYLGGNRFVHAASSGTNGVMISNLADRYWRTRFDGGRRVAAMQDEARAPDFSLE